MTGDGQQQHPLHPIRNGILLGAAIGGLGLAGATRFGRRVARPFARSLQGGKRLKLAEGKVGLRLRKARNWKHRAYSWWKGGKVAAKQAKTEARYARARVRLAKIAEGKSPFAQ